MTKTTTNATNATNATTPTNKANKANKANNVVATATVTVNVIDAKVVVDKEKNRRNYLVYLRNKESDKFKANYSYAKKLVKYLRSYILVLGTTGEALILKQEISLANKHLQKLSITTESYARAHRKASLAYYHRNKSTKL